MASQKTYYDILGISKNASDADIKKAFRKLAATHHPDRGGSEEKFKEISEAYTTLSDPKKRQQYDQYLQFGGASGGFGSSYGAADFSDLFENFQGGGFGGFDFSTIFGGGARGPRPMRGKDLTLTVMLTAEEALTETTRKATYRIPSTGEEESITIKVPAGAIDGGKLRYRRRGEYGMAGGERGDLVVTTKVAEHPLFKRDGAHIRMEVPLSIFEATLGTTLEIPTPRGSSVRLKIPAGTQDGKTFRMKGLGAPQVKKPDTNGDLFVIVKVVVPTKLSDREHELMSQLAEEDTRSYRDEVTRYGSQGTRSTS